MFLWRTEPQLWFFLSGKQGIYIVQNRKEKMDTILNLVHELTALQDEPKSTL